MMLKANCSGSWWTYWSRFSNHSRLACAARCVERTTALRSVSYVASAAPRSSPSSTASCRQAARASASSIASLVPEPIEKCAVCAASPRMTTALCRRPVCTQCSLRTVVKLIQRELLARTSWPSSTSANSSRIRSIDRVVGLAGRPRPVGVLGEARLLPDRGGHLDDERAAGGVEGVAVDLHHAVRRLRDVELEGVEHLVGAQPDVLAVTLLEGRPERVGVPAADRGLEPVAGDDEVVGAGQLVDVRRLGAEVDRHAELAAAGLQDLQQPLA